MHMKLMPVGRAKNVRTKKNGSWESNESGKRSRLLHVRDCERKGETFLVSISTFTLQARTVLFVWQSWSLSMGCITPLFLVAALLSSLSRGAKVQSQAGDSSPRAKRRENARSVFYCPKRGLPAHAEAKCTRRGMPKH